jgi:phospholipid transport system substrate-binding protein
MTVLTAVISLSLAAGAGNAPAADKPPAKAAPAPVAEKVSGKSAPAAPVTSPAPAAEAPSPGPGNPVDVIRAKDTELQKLLRDKQANQKTDRIKELINGIFDFEELGRRALGKETWAKMPPAQQARFVKAFREMVENSSVKKLEVYASDSTRYEAPEIRGDKATVTAHVFSKGAESIVTYKLLVKQGRWKAWDLVIDDLSTAGNYGDQFRKILEKDSMDQLIVRLEKKAKSDVPAKSADNVKSKSEKASQDAATKDAAAKQAAKKNPSGS